MTATDVATAWDVALDLLAIVDESPSGRLVGSEDTTIAEVKPGEGSRPTTFHVVLDNGQLFTISVEDTGIWS